MYTDWVTELLDVRCAISWSVYLTCQVLKCNVALGAKIMKCLSCWFHKLHVWVNERERERDSCPWNEINIGCFRCTLQLCTIRCTHWVDNAFIVSTRCYCCQRCQHWTPYCFHTCLSVVSQHAHRTDRVLCLRGATVVAEVLSAGGMHASSINPSSRSVPDDTLVTQSNWMTLTFVHRHPNDTDIRASSPL